MAFDVGNPLDGSLISAFPLNERGNRVDFKDNIINDHNETTGDHSKVGLIPDDIGPAPGQWGLAITDPIPDGLLGFVYTKV